MKMNFKQNNIKLAIAAGLVIGSAGLTVPAFAASPVQKDMDVTASIAVAGGAAKLGMSLAGRKGRIREQQKAKEEMRKMRKEYENLDTSNLAANMENAYEDLTVNTQAADFAAQQQQQALANTMGGMNAAAGGSGIAALAQAMAGQQSQNLQQASASIASQESANQMAAAKGDMAVQSAEIQGAQQARAAELDKTETLLGMSQQRLGAANAARQKATDSLVGGIAQAGMGAAMGKAAGDAANPGGGGNFFSNMFSAAGIGG